MYLFSDLQMTVQSNAEQMNQRISSLETRANVVDDVFGMSGKDTGVDIKFNNHTLYLL